MKDIEIRDYMDQKFDKIEAKHRNRQHWITTLIVFVVIALVTSGFVNAKVMGGMQKTTEILWKEYVPGDLFLAVIHSFDLQNRYTLSLLNGDQEEADRTYREFINFRDKIYEQHFSTRGSVVPTGGGLP